MPDKTPAIGATHKRPLNIQWPFVFTGDLYTCMAGIPDNWYEFEDRLPEVRGAPVPSQADYSPKNVAPLIEFFAGVIGRDKADVTFVYENNTPNNTNDNIAVSHPNDRSYYSDWLRSFQTKSSEMLRYEAAAKKSARLAAFEANSPAKITYFKRTAR